MSTGWLFLLLARASSLSIAPSKPINGYKTDQAAVAAMHTQHLRSVYARLTSGLPPKYTDELINKPEWDAIDVVMVSRSVNCHVALSVHSLVKRLNPRRVIVIAREGQCDKAEEKFKDIPQEKVKCVSESSAVNGLSLNTVTQGFKDLESAGICAEPRAGHDKPEGWFLQQYLKLGYPVTHEDVSEHVLIWDADMAITDTYKYHNAEGQVLYPGGDWSGDTRFYKPVMQDMVPDVEWSDHRVDHHMLMYKPYIKEMLDAFERADLPKEQKLNALPKWLQNSMVAACTSNTQSQKQHTRFYGFSEYGFYASWAIQHHPVNACEGGNKEQKLKRKGTNFGNKDVCTLGEEEFNANNKLKYPGVLIAGHEQHLSGKR